MKKLKKLLSKENWQKLSQGQLDEYALYQKSSSFSGERIFAVVAIVVIMVLLTSLIQKQYNESRFLNTSDEYTQLQLNNIKATVAEPCDKGTCEIPTQSVTDFGSLNTEITNWIYKNPSDEKEVLVHLHLMLDEVDPKKALSFPFENYQNAVFIQGEKVIGNCFGRGSCYVMPVTDSNQIKIELSLSRDWAKYGYFRDTPIVQANSWYMDYLKTFHFFKKNGIGELILVLIKILLAVFTLLIFLVIERSPETLALCLFTSMDALGFLVGLPKIRPPILPDSTPIYFVRDIFFGLETVFRLYFCAQITRTLNLKLKTWWIGGLLFAIPYGYTRHLGVQNGWYWSDQLWAVKSILFYTPALALCAWSLYHLFKERLVRRASTIVAVTVVFFTLWMGAVGNFVDGFSPYGAAKPVFDLIFGYSSLILVICSLLNFAGLEKRVKVLMDEAKKNMKLRQQLSLARELQNSFYEADSKPKEIVFSKFYSPAEYVSGDMFFSHWDAGRQKFTAILNDITGHGIRASLKSFGSSVIAKNIWRELPDEELESDNWLKKLNRFELELKDLLVQKNMPADIAAFSAASLDMKQQKISFYRSNYMFPLLINDRSKHAKVIPTPNNKVVELDLEPGIFVALISDGLVESGREFSNLARYITKKLEQTPANIPDQIKEWILEWRLHRPTHHPDDQTLLVFGVSHRTGKRAKDNAA